MKLDCFVPSGRIASFLNCLFNDSHENPSKGKCEYIYSLVFIINMVESQPTEYQQATFNEILNLQEAKEVIKNLEILKNNPDLCDYSSSQKSGLNYILERINDVYIC